MNGLRDEPGAPVFLLRAHVPDPALRAPVPLTLTHTLTAPRHRAV
jgi:hypothetical protein